MKKIDYLKKLTPKQQLNALQWYLTYKSTGNPPYPLVAKIELTRKCNANCQMCKLPTLPKYPEMNLEQLKAILKQLPNTIIIAPHGFGEPYSHSNIQPLLDAIKVAGKQIALVTNGQELNLINISNLYNLKPLRITISIDAATKENYETIRKGLSFNKLKENLHFLDLINNGHAQYTEVEYYCTLGKYNQQEIKPLIELATLNHANKISFVCLDTHGTGTATEENQADTTQAKAEISLNTPQNTTLEIHQYFDTPRTCTVPYDEIFIQANGDIHPCCKTLTWHIGNAYKDNLKQIWKSNRYQTFRTLFKENKIPECNKCKGTTANNLSLKYQKGEDKKQ